MEPRIETVTTLDGAKIACKRRPADGPPLIFVHGLAVNADLWDIPDLRGEGFAFRSLPTLLHERGCDIWLVNLRGHGAPHMHSAPPPGQSDWCVDHFILYDLRAVTEQVAAQTGKRPFLIGNSMGAMTCAGYLQGASIIGYGAQETIVADESAARRRQAAIAGSVLVEFPAALRWPQSLYGDSDALRWAELLRDWRRTDSDLNYPFEWLARTGWLHVALETLGEVRLDWLRPPPRTNLPNDVSGASRSWMEQAKAAAMRFFAKNIKGASTFQPELFLDGLLHAVDHMKAGVLRQMGKSVRARSFVSGLGQPDHVYADHYDLIESPTLVIAGGRDRIANAAVTREVFFDRVRSPDKSFLLFKELAHGEFEYSTAATEEVYPRIVEWVLERSA